MATLVHQNTQDTSESAAVSTIQVSQPTGLSVGDLLIGHLSFRDAAVGDVITMPSGFTEIIKTESSTTLTSQVSYKIADSGDVAASHFSYSWSVSTCQAILSMSRISGQRLANMIAASTGTAEGAVSSVATASGITPAIAQSMILIFTSNSNARTTASQTIATSPPTFTEMYDRTVGSVGNSNALGAAAAYGVRTESTGTGIATATLSGAGDTTVIQMVSVTPQQDLTATHVETITATDTLNIIRGLGLSVNETVILTDTASATEAKNWVTQNKNSSNWTNIDKS